MSEVFGRIALISEMVINTAPILTTSTSTVFYSTNIQCSM